MTLIQSSTCYDLQYSSLPSSALTEEQCRSTFDADRVGLIAIYRFACENALDRVGLITTEDISVLQYLVLYLVRITARIPSLYVAKHILIDASVRRAHI